MPNDRLSWPGALARAFSPPRLALGALGLALTIASVRLLAFWTTGPMHELAASISRWPPGGFAEPFLQGGPGLALRAWAWGLLLWAPCWALPAGWIARAELRAPAGRPGPGPTGFVVRKATALISPPLLLLGMALFGLAFAALFPFLNALLGPTLGALVLAVAFPALLTVWSVVAVLAVGSLSWPIMPAAVAAEGQDAYDALSRACNYLALQPLAFALWSGLAAALAAAPAALALHAAARDLVPQQAGPATVFAGLAAGASVFWSLQPLVYLRIRRLVDDVPEGQVWDGEDSPAAPTDATPTATPPGAPPPAQVPLQHRDAFSLGDTSTLGGACRPTLLLGFLTRLALVGLLTLGALQVAAASLDPPPPVHGPEGRGEVLRRMAEERPALLLVLAGALVVAITPLLRSHLTYAARLIALGAVFGPGADSHLPARRFATRRASEATAPSALFAAAAALYALALLLVPTSPDAPWPWRLWLALAGASLAAGAAGALGLGGLAVSRSSEDGFSAIAPPSPGPADLLLSAALALPRGALRIAAAAGLLALAWWMACDSLTWFGGQAGWARWGLNGRLAPAPEGAAARLASYLTGAYFALLAGLVLAAPLAGLLRWGVVNRLRAAAPQARGVHQAPIALAPGERDELSARRQ